MKAITPSSCIGRSSFSNSSNRSSNNYVVLFVKILLVIIILLWLPNTVDGKRRGRKRRRAKALLTMVHRKRAECEMKCMHLHPVVEESMNCVFDCISSKCYQELYSASPLEPGEIDLTRASQFEYCAKNELRIQRSQRK